MRLSLLSTFVSLIALAGCGGVTGAPTAVTSLGTEDFLKLRAGPGLGYRVILGLPEGTPLRRKDCITELSQLWCQVALAEAPGLTGYDAADYLTQR